MHRGANYKMMQHHFFLAFSLEAVAAGEAILVSDTERDLLVELLLLSVGATSISLQRNNIQ